MADTTVTLTEITSTGDYSAGLPSTRHSVGDMLEYGRRQSNGANGRYDEKIIDWINDGIQDIYPNLPDFAFVYEFSKTTSSGTSEYAIDTASYLYRRIVPGTVRLDGDPIPAYPYHDWARYKDDNEFTTTSSSNTSYVIQPRQRPTDGLTYIELYPVPSSSETLAGSYVYIPGDIQQDEESASIPLPPQAKGVLRKYVYWQTRVMMGNSIQDIQLAQQAYQASLAVLKNDMNKRGNGSPVKREANQAPYRNYKIFNPLDTVYDGSNNRHLR